MKKIFIIAIFSTFNSQIWAQNTPGVVVPPTAKYFCLDENFEGVVVDTANGAVTVWSPVAKDGTGVLVGIPNQVISSQILADGVQFNSQARLDFEELHGLMTIDARIQVAGGLARLSSTIRLQEDGDPNIDTGPFDLDCVIR